MILWLLLSLRPLPHGASIPPQPVIPTASACLQGCFAIGKHRERCFRPAQLQEHRRRHRELLQGSESALYFRTMITSYLNLNSALLKCGRECPPEQIAELEARTHASSFICSNKIEEFRLVSGCLDGATDVTAACASECGVPTDVPFRLDSSPAASVNPAVFLDGVAGICKKEICLMRCSQKGLNKECAGAGDLFKDMARHQVRSGVETLTAAAADENATTVHFMAENYLKNLPTECAFLKDVDEFEKTTPIVVEEQPAETVNPTSTRSDPSNINLTLFKGQTTVVPVLEGGFIAEGETGHVTIELPDEEEEGEVKTVVVMTTPSAEATEAEEKETSHEESKGDIGMDVNEITSPAPTEPVIVVDDTPSDIDENRVQAGTKQEVETKNIKLDAIGVVKDVEKGSTEKLSSEEVGKTPGADLSKTPLTSKASAEVVAGSKEGASKDEGASDDKKSSISKAPAESLSKAPVTSKASAEGVTGSKEDAKDDSRGVSEEKKAIGSAEKLEFEKEKKSDEPRLASKEGTKFNKLSPEPSKPVEENIGEAKGAREESKDSKEEVKGSKEEQKESDEKEDEPEKGSKEKVSDDVGSLGENEAQENLNRHATIKTTPGESPFGLCSKLIGELK
ncbi:hypothetical protein OSTOST_17443 [Ostertagia ostertagi]